MTTGARLKKRLGQHHLRAGTLCQPVIDFLRPRGRAVLEIGPGGGVLTRELLGAGARVLAWELDPDWAFYLARDSALGSASLVLGDALDLAWERLPQGTLVAGNLPYGISTALIDQLLERAEGVPRAAFLLQLEVTRRLAAGPGESQYGAASVLTRARAAVSVLGQVARGSFRPAPRVDGAFLGLVRRPPPLPTTEMPGFTATVRLAFALRRKTLRNALAAGWGRQRAEEVLRAVGIDRRVRAQQLSLEDFVALYQQHRKY